jgi:hypothetical protein
VQHCYAHGETHLLPNTDALDLDRTDTAGL